jgi:hypothetical protein
MTSIMLLCSLADDVGSSIACVLECTLRTLCM